MATAAFGTPGGVGYVDPFAPKPITPVTPPPQNPPTPPAPVATTPATTPTTPTSYDYVGGKAVPTGTTPPAPAASTTQTPTSNTPAAPTTDPRQAQIDADTKAKADAQAKMVTDANTTSQVILDMGNGATPLSAAETAQINALDSQWKQMINVQLANNRQGVGKAQISGAQQGSLEYDPYFQARTIGAIVQAGAAKVSDMQLQEAAAVAKLTQAFHDNDIAAIKDAYAIRNDAAKASQDALQKTIDDTAKAMQDAQAEADKVKQYNLDVDKFNQTKDQNAFDDALKTEQEKFDETYKNKTYALDAFKAGYGAGGAVPGVSQSAQIGADGNPDPASQQSVLNQISTKYGPMTATAIKSLANYTMNPADWSSRSGGKGMSRADAVSLAQMYDPTYSDTNYTIRAAYLKSISSTQSGTVGNAVNAANKSINHLTAYVNSMNKLAPNILSSSSTLNALANATSLSPERRANIHEAQTEGLGVAEELAKFFKGSGTVDVASIDAWKSQLSTNASPADIRGTTQGAITLLTGQLEVLAEQYKSTMGKAPESDFLNESARASLSGLKDKGYTVDIPGIYYTDVNAYKSNDPDAVDNMKSATTALQNAGLPLTPENILQAAQAI